MSFEVAFIEMLPKIMEKNVRNSITIKLNGVRNWYFKSKLMHKKYIILVLHFYLFVCIFHHGKSLMRENIK